MKNKEKIFNALEQELFQAKMHLSNLSEMIKVLKSNID